MSRLPIQERAWMPINRPGAAKHLIFCHYWTVKSQSFFVSRFLNITKKWFIHRFRITVKYVTFINYYITNKSHFFIYM